MAVAGTLTYDTSIDKTGFEKGLNSITNSVKTGGNKIKDIVSALGITKIISTALNTINNSIDGAVARIDTLNNFPKVMTNLGIASEDSEKAINKLSDGLQGIPTKLDDAALAVQRFTSKNDDVDKSVDLFLAVNNALLAGGASAEIQSSAMEQLSQAYAKGKPDMIEWRSIQTAMPAQLKQISKEILGNSESLDIFLQKAEEYAANNPLSASGAELVEQLEAVKQGTGDMTTALGTALRLGIISMDDFLDTIVKLNKEGTEEFLSLEKQAKNATGGIKTSITNAKTAITRGVAKIVEAFDKVLKDNGLGGISDLISKIGKTAEKVLNKIATSLIPKVVAKIKDICNWIKENQDALKKLIAIIGAVTAGYVAYKAVLMAINAIQIVKNIVSAVSAFLSLVPAIKSAKDAMTLLNIAFNANPIGLVISAIAGLIAALTLLSSTQTEEQKQAEEFAKSMQDAKKTMEEYNASVDESMNKELSHMNNISLLRNELSKLVDENGKVKKGYESRVDFILNELNSALGTEYKLNGNIIQNYKDLQKEIDLTIEKKRAQIILNAEEKKYTEAIENQDAALENLATAQQNLNNLLKEKNMTLKELETYYEGSNSKEAQAVHNTINAYNDALSTVQTYTENIISYEDIYALYTEGKYDEINNKIKGSTKDWSDSSLETIKNGIKEQKTALDTYAQIYNDTGNELAKQQKQQAETNLQNLADELVKRTKAIDVLGDDEILAWKTLATTSTTIYSEVLGEMPETTRKNIEEATGIVADSTLPEGLNRLASGGILLYDSTLDLETPTEQEIGKAEKALSRDESIKNASAFIADEAGVSFSGNMRGYTWGEDLTSNVASGMQSKKSQNWIVNAATSVAGWIKSIIGHSVPKTGPLKDELTYMPDMIENLVKGIEKNRYKIVNATTDMAEDIKDSFNLEELNSEIINKMNRAIEIETSAINTDVGIKAIIREENRKPRTVTNDNGTVINNTQNFYEKNPTPYEQQKQAKQQLRRLAYEL